MGGAAERLVFHLVDTCLVVAADADVLTGVLEVVLKHQTNLGIEIGAVVGHELIIGWVEPRAVFHLGATGQHRHPHRFPIGMNQSAESVFVRLVASGVELFLGERGRASHAAARRSENLHQIGAHRLILINVRANLLRCPVYTAAPAERANGGQNARSGNLAAIDGVAQRHVFGRSHALHRSESAHKRVPGVPRYRQEGMLGRFVFADALPGVLAVEPEMPTDVDVAIDPARHHR